MTRRRQSFSDAEKAQIAWMAGQGHSASEIAQTIGNTTPATIYYVVRRMGIAMAEKKPTSVAFVCRCDRTQFDQLLLAAFDRGIDPPALAGQILAAVLAEPVLLANLLDEQT